MRDQPTPCDIAIVYSSGEKNSLYVETKNLDGETNLKPRSVPQDISQNDQIFKDLNGTIMNSEPPNNLIDKFNGNIDWRSGKVSLSAENIMLRGCSLRNTASIYGIAVFTGHETKIFKNSMKPEYKFSKLERLTTRAIIMIFTMQFTFALIGAIFGFTWIKNNQTLLPADSEDCKTFPIKDQCTEAYYIEQSQEGLISPLTFIKKLGNWVLIMTNLVPISLLVTLEFVKFIQGAFMGWDLNMTNDKPGVEDDDIFFATAQSSNLNEELGQVEYIFSDKTGTLTQNVMNFKKFTAGEEAFGTDEAPVAPQLKNVSFNDENFDPQIEGLMDDPLNIENDKNGLYWVMLHLALNHSVIIDRDTKQYNAASPDEMALVNFAKQYKFEYKGVEFDEDSGE